MTTKREPFTLYEKSMLLIFTNMGSQAERLLGFAPIWIPRKEKGKKLILHDRKAEATCRKFEPTLKPKILLL